jgi:hypothetical protein
MLLSSQQSNARPGGHKKVPGIKSGGAAMSADDHALRNDSGIINHPMRIWASKKDGPVEEFAVMGSYEKLCDDLFYFLLGSNGPKGVFETDDCYGLQSASSFSSPFSWSIFRHVRFSRKEELGNLPAWEIKRIGPDVSFIFAELWTAFRIEIEKPLWLFYQRTHLGFTRINVPREINVTEDGSIALPRRAYLKPDKHPWPWPLLNYHSPAYQGLDSLLTRGSENTLTMLAESAQPYSGLARTLIKKLSEIKEQVLLSSPWPNEPINLK